MTFTKGELLMFNEKMLNRGVPNMDDGIGYNKADYGACSTYYHGLSDAQYADLAKRLVKYSETQLQVCKQKMKETAKELSEIANPDERSKGISIEVGETHTLLGLRYNSEYINIISSTPRRRYDEEKKAWIIPNDLLINTLNNLREIGADVRNAVEYAESKGITKDYRAKVVVLTEPQGEMIALKFNYNKDIVEEIKRIDKRDRKWNADNKIWSIKPHCMESLKEKLSSIATFKSKVTNLF